MKENKKHPKEYLFIKNVSEKTPTILTDIPCDSQLGMVIQNMSEKTGYFSGSTPFATFLTKKKPQHRNTKLLTISMSADVKEVFDEFCNENSTNKSKLISWLIQQHLGKIKEQKEAGEL